jgi:hypothetical protein
MNLSNVLNINLHHNQLKILHDPNPIKVVCAGRGFGKTRYLRASAIKACFSYKGKFDPESPPEALLVGPTLKMIRDLHWDSLLALFENSPLTLKIDKSRYRIYFKNNLPILSLAGVDDGGERIRGKNLIYAGAEEYQLFPSNTWNEILTPCFRDPSGFYQADVIGTPAGKNSHFYKFHLQALNTPDWKYYHFTSADNPFHPKKLRELAKLTLPPKVYRAEYEASWEDFSNQIFDQLEEKHCIDILPNPSEYDKVFIGLDHGAVNPYIVCIGLKGNQYFIFDAWENPNPNSPVVLDTVIEQCAKFSTQHNAYRAYSPDDNPSIRVSLIRHGKKHDIKGLCRTVDVCRTKPGLMERLGIVNSLFYQNRLFISKKLQPLITDFQSFHKAQDREGLVVEKPADNQRDHSCMAAAYVLGTLEFNYDMNKAS